MRLLRFGREIALCNFIAVQQFCVGEEVPFDVNWSFSSTTIVFPHDGAFRLSLIKVPREWFREEDSPEGCTFILRNCSADNSAAKQLRSTGDYTQDLARIQGSNG